MSRYLLGIFLLMSILPCLGDITKPIKVTVPSKKVWCVSSQPVEIEKDPEGLRFGDLIFDELFRRLQRQAFSTSIVSMGVPFLESAIQVTTPASATTLTDPEPAVVKHILKVCSVVPKDAPQPPTGVEGVSVPQMDGLALLCDVTNGKECELAIEVVLRNEYGISEDDIRKTHWRTSQPLSNEATAGAMENSLVDFTLRPLLPEIATPKPPLNLMIVWTSVPQ